MESVCWMCNKVVSIFWIENGYDNQQRRRYPMIRFICIWFLHIFVVVIIFDISRKRRTNQLTDNGLEWKERERKTKQERKNAPQGAATVSVYWLLTGCVFVETHFDFIIIHTFPYTIYIFVLLFDLFSLFFISFTSHQIILPCSNEILCGKVDKLTKWNNNYLNSLFFPFICSVARENTQC